MLETGIKTYRHKLESVVVPARGFYPRRTGHETRFGPIQHMQTQRQQRTTGMDNTIQSVPYMRIKSVSSLLREDEPCELKLTMSRTRLFTGSPTED